MGLTIRSMHSDGAKEFFKGAVLEYCKQAGVEQSITDTKTSKGNSRVERLIETISGMTRAILVYSQLPFVFWLRAMKYAVWCHNVLVSSRTGSTPTFRMFGRVPDLRFAIVWGCTCFVRNVSRSLKLDLKIEPVGSLGFPVGVAEPPKIGYEIFVPKAGRNKRDVLLTTEEAVMLPMLEPRHDCPAALRHLRQVGQDGTTEKAWQWHELDQLDEADLEPQGKLGDIITPEVLQELCAKDGACEGSDDADVDVVDVEDGDDHAVDGGAEVERKDGTAASPVLVEAPETEERETEREIDLARVKSLEGQEIVLNEGEGPEAAYVRARVVGPKVEEDGSVTCKVEAPGQIVARACGRTEWRVPSETVMRVDEVEKLLIDPGEEDPVVERRTFVPRCPRGHLMREQELAHDGGTCDSCHATGHTTEFKKGQVILECTDDDHEYDVCPLCRTEGAKRWDPDHRPPSVRRSRRGGVAKEPGSTEAKAVRQAAEGNKAEARKLRASRRRLARAYTKRWSELGNEPFYGPPRKPRRTVSFTGCAKAKERGPRPGRLGHHYTLMSGEAVRVDLARMAPHAGCTDGIIQGVAEKPRDEWQEGDPIRLWGLSGRGPPTAKAALRRADTRHTTGVTGEHRRAAGEPYLEEVLLPLVAAPSEACGAGRVVMVCTSPTHPRGSVGGEFGRLRGRYRALHESDKRDKHQGTTRVIGDVCVHAVDSEPIEQATVENPRPATREVHVATFYPQVRGGPTHHVNNAEARCRRAAFTDCLSRLEEEMEWSEGDTVALPFKVCCKGAGGDWRRYRIIIAGWAEYMDNARGVKVQLYRDTAGRPPAMSKSDMTSAMRAIAAGVEVAEPTVSREARSPTIDELVSHVHTRAARIDELQLSMSPPDEVIYLRRMVERIRKETPGWASETATAGGQGEAEAKQETKRERVPQAGTSKSNPMIGIHRQLSRTRDPNTELILDMAAVEGTDLFRICGGNADPSMFDGALEPDEDDFVATNCIFCGDDVECACGENRASGPDFRRVSEDEHLRTIGVNADCSFMPDIPCYEYEGDAEDPLSRRERVSALVREHDMYHSTVMRKLESMMDADSDQTDDLYVDGDTIKAMPDAIELEAQNVEAWAAAVDAETALAAIMQQTDGDPALLRLWRESLNERTALKMMMDYTDQASLEPDIRDALTGPAKYHWMDVCFTELLTQDRMGTWKLVPSTHVPQGANCFQTGWRLKVKLKQTSTGFKVDWRKARFCGGGDSQVKGKGWEISTSPCPRATSVRWILSKAADRGWANAGVDVTGAFLLGKLEKPLYGEVPLYFGPGENPLEAAAAAPTNARRRRPGQCPWVLEFYTGIYGARQSSRMWWELWSHFLTKELGFTQSTGDCCVFERTRNGKTIVLVGHVDDLCGTFNDEGEWDGFVKAFLGKFPGRNEGITTDYLGVRVVQKGQEGGIQGIMKNNVVDLIQPGLASSVIEGLGIGEGDGVEETPLRPGIKLRSPLYRTPEKYDGVKENDPDRLAPMTPDEEAEVGQVNYRRALGQCIYLACWTRPDIGYAVSQLARFSSPDRTHITHVRALRHLGRYLNGTRDMGLRYTGSAGKDIVVWADSDWATCPESRKSVTGWVVTMRGAAIAWGSARQKTVAQSSTEAEIIATRDAVGELVAIGFDHKTIEGEAMPPKRPFMEDNSGCMAIAEGGGNMHTRKHIHIKYLLAREAVYNNLIKMVKVDTAHMVADALTKSLDAVLFSKHRASMMGRGK